MIIVAVVNNKGGVSKTTTAINIAAKFASEGDKTLLIDFDSQANATLLTVGTGIKKHTGTWLTGYAKFDDVVVNYSENLDVLPSSNELDEDALFVSKKQDYQFILQERIEEDKLKDKYDFIIIDNAPSLSTLTYLSLIASTHVLIPSNPEFSSYKGIENILLTVQNVKKRYNKNLKIIGIFFSKYHISYRKSIIHDIVAATKDTFPQLVMNTYIRDNVSLTESGVKKKSIFDYAPDSNGAIDYNNLFEEIKTRL